MTRESETSGDEIVHVPVPKRFLPAVYRALAEAMTATTGVGKSVSESREEYPTGRRNLIDLIRQAAVGIDADQRPVSLAELHAAYIRAYPGVGKGTSRGSFDATVNYHCINMRSRFPDARDRHKSANWLSQPVFKRVSRAQYMLLSPQEVAQFRRALEEGTSLVYEDEYDVTDLAMAAGAPM